MDRNQEIVLTQMRKSVEKLMSSTEISNQPILFLPEIRNGHSLTQMRKSVEKLMSSTEKYGDPALMRFLIARSMDPDKTAKMFVQWQKWWTALVPSGFISDSEVGDELGSKKIYLQGLSKNGHPVIIVSLSYFEVTKDHGSFKGQEIGNEKLTAVLDLQQITFKNIDARGLITGFQFLQQDISFLHGFPCTFYSSFKGREIGNEKLTAVFDLQQITFKNIDARGLITGFQFLQITFVRGQTSGFDRKSGSRFIIDDRAYYPERLAKCFILNMPRFSVSVWRIVCRFLEKATLEKIVIVNNEDEMREFVREIGEEALPEEYGGRATLVALQDVVLTPL
ncbi:unnamed protein product, partial [Ilex paraguariensis]